MAVVLGSLVSEESRNNTRCLSMVKLMLHFLSRLLNFCHRGSTCCILHLPSKWLEVLTIFFVEPKGTGFLEAVIERLDLT